MTEPMVDELEIARAIADGRLPSPQQYGSLWLFDIRITGTGASYRPSLNEYVWRDKSLYLTDDFLARCNGLPVVWVHPEAKTMVDGKEWQDRAIGTVFLPHIRGDEVWGVAKIYDEGAAGVMASDPVSTSPGVVFSTASDNQELKLKDGSTLLIEGKPALLDHIAIVSAGVWDKGGPPSGVSTGVTMADEKDKAEERVDAAAVMDALKHVGAKLDAAHERLDGLEKHRKDAARKDRLDAARKDRFGHRKDGESDEDYKKRHDADEHACMDALRADGASEEEAREDAAHARKDAEDKEEKERMDAAHRKDESEKEKKEAEAKKDAARKDAALTEENEGLKKRIAALESSLAGLTRELSPDERNAVASAQSRADAVMAAFGQRASAPIAGETSVAYRRRLLQPLLQHSAKCKDVKLDTAEGSVLDMIENQVFSDAAEASRRIDSAAPGVLIPVISTDAAGRRITTFNGDNLAWMRPFMSPGNVCKINRNPNKAA